MRERGLWLLSLWLAGCAAEPQRPAPAPAPAPPPAGVVVAPEIEPLAQEPELCPVLAALMAGEMEGFARLRGPEVASEAWQAQATVPGTERCTIEGDGWPRARLVCAGEPLPADRAQIALNEFDQLAEKIDQCLQRPSWFPRDWRKGQLFQFAMGERLQAWTDHSSSPPSAVVLKVQQDLASRDYSVQLNLETVR